MSAYYLKELDHVLGAILRVEFTSKGPEVLDYAVVLLREVGQRIETVRLYDGAHGVNEMHRYTRTGGKQRAVIFHGGTLGDGMRAAIAEVESSYRTVIEGWEGR